MPAIINQTDVILNHNIVKPSASVLTQALLAVQPLSPRSSTIHHPRPSPSYGHSLYFISFLDHAFIKWRDCSCIIGQYLLKLYVILSLFVRSVLITPTAWATFLIHWEDGSIAYARQWLRFNVSLLTLSPSLPDNPLRSILFTGPSPIKICHRGVCNKEIALNDRSAFYCMFLSNVARSLFKWLISTATFPITHVHFFSHRHPPLNLNSNLHIRTIWIPDTGLPVGLQ